MRVLIQGLGSIGQRHLRNVRRVLPDARVAALRHRRDSPAVLGVDETFCDLDAALAFDPDIAILAGPAPFRVPTARALASIGVHLFLEKPMAAQLEGVEDLLAVAKDKDIRVMVGYVLRFHAVMRAVAASASSGRLGALRHVHVEVGQDLRTWRPGSDPADSVSAQAALGGGAVLELSHELDVLLWLGGKPSYVDATLARVSDLPIDVEDLAEVTVSFESGAIGHAHLDFLQNPASRRGKATFELGSLTWDLIEGEAFESLDGTVQPLVRSGSLDRNDMYLDELTHFLECVDQGLDPSPSAQDGLSVLEVIVAAKQSSATRRRVTL